ncbi:response regulator [Tindallia californiensis]|uniref:response regulator n=1 Tax=Tindallia californiensis TaxID=159292 RepID=UPI001FA796CD|nr:response regulator [Tindallia californiensis]
MRVLIVDDATILRKLIRMTLEEIGHEVVGEAENGFKAVLKCADLKPDVIFLDITMPEMDGLTAIPKLIEKNPSVKIVVCSALGQKAMIIQAIKSGAVNFIVKPFEKETIKKVMQVI